MEGVVNGLEQLCAITFVVVAGVLGCDAVARLIDWWMDR